MHTFIFTAAILISAAAAEAKPTDCKTLKSPSALLACYDAKNKARAVSEKQVFGKVQGAITWQYNNFVGTKGDVGAKILLVASPFEDTLKKLNGPEAGLLSLGYGLPGWDKYGIYSAEADGFGNFLIDGVPAGSYEVFVFSAKTRPGPEDYSTNGCKARFAKYFGSMPDYKDLAFLIHKAYCTSVTVSEDRTSMISHDFGNTYI